VLDPSQQIELVPVEPVGALTQLNNSSTGRSPRNALSFAAFLHYTLCSTNRSEHRKHALGRPPRSPPVTKDGDGDSRIAPDPLSVVLPAISALGAITSIAAVNWIGQERTSERTRSRRKVGLVIRDLESCCLGLQEVFKRLNRIPRLFAGEGAAAGSPLKFGVHGPRVDTVVARIFHQLMNDVASMLVLASQSAFDIMCAIEDGEIVAPEQLFFGFGEQQERLNKLIQERATLKALVETGLEVANALQALVSEFKKYKAEPT
jgi:hypothetical protein